MWRCVDWFWPWRWETGSASETSVTVSVDMKSYLKRLFFQPCCEVLKSHRWKLFFKDSTLCLLFLLLLTEKAVWCWKLCHRNYVQHCSLHEFLPIFFGAPHSSHGVTCLGGLARLWVLPPLAFVWDITRTRDNAMCKIAACGWQI